MSTYVTRQDTREQIDIHALNAEIEAIVEKSVTLRTQINTLIAELV